MTLTNLNLQVDCLQDQTSDTDLFEREKYEKICCLDRRFGSNVQCKG